MKRITTLVALFALSAQLLVADVTFNKVKLADVKGKQADARLTFNDADRKMIVRVADRDLVAIPYESLDKISYEYTKKHRITQGAIVMVASLGAGAIVMLTKSKSHWLYLDYHDQSAAKSVVLRMDKSEYRQILDAVKPHTGREVEYLGSDNKPNK